jgi:hypothetical protein
MEAYKVRKTKVGSFIELLCVSSDQVEECVGANCKKKIEEDRNNNLFSHQSERLYTINLKAITFGVSFAKNIMT